MRVVILGVVAFLLSLGGTTGALVMKARKAAAIVADSLAAHPDSAAAHADSAKVKGDSSASHPAAVVAHADSARPLPDPTHAAPDSAARGDSTSSGAATSSLGASPTGHEAPLSAEATGPKGAAYKQLARIFSNMKTTDAAKVLAYMSDEEVQGVLEQLGVRPAAGLLAALPKERAAILSRRMLGAGGKKNSAP